MDNKPNGAPDREPTPLYKRVLAIVGVAAVLGFVVWLAVSMVTLGG